MASAWRKLDRWILLLVTGILATSTGVASIGTGEAEAVAGHTAFVQIVREAGADGGRQAPPVEYGLATFQEVWLFGAYTRTRVIDEGGARMVFGWNAEHPDPRDDPTLTPTGQHAVVMDRNGNGWSLYEFSYRGVDAADDDDYARWLDGTLADHGTYHAYGVRLGTVHHHEGDWDGEKRYNWVLSYRLDKLFPDGPTVPAFDPARVAAAQPAAGAVGDVAEMVTESDSADGTVEVRPAPEPRPAEYHLEFGLGLQPESMDRHDPAGGGIDRFYQ